MTKVTYICRSPEKKVVTYFILFLFLFFIDFFNRVFGRFVTRGVQKHDKKNRKNPSGLITKNAAFFYSVFFFTLGCFARFFFNRVFWAFRNKGSSKTRLKKSWKYFRSRQKKYLVLTYHRIRHFFFHGPPCSPPCLYMGRRGSSEARKPLTPGSCAVAATG
jgi:hypothetical protein